MVRFFLVFSIGLTLLLYGVKQLRVITPDSIPPLEQLAPQSEPIEAPRPTPGKSPEHAHALPSVAPEAYQGNLSAGFQSLTHETVPTKLAISGALPSWLTGSLIAVGSALFDIEGTSPKYWFEGLAMLHSFTFDDNNITYFNRFLPSTHYEKCIKKGKFIATSATEQPKKSLFAKLSNAFAKPPIYDNCNATLSLMNNELIAMTETPHAFSIDPHTLGIKGQHQFDITIAGHIMSPYPQYDTYTQKWYTYITEFGNNSLYHFYSIDTHGAHHKIASLPAKNPAYMRSFGMTRQYLILIETPLVVNPFDLLFATSGSFIEEFTWQPKRGTNFTVIHKQTGNVVGTYNSPAFFMFHTINAFEKDNTLVIDCITYEDPSIIKTLQLATLRCNQPFIYPAAYPTSYVINLHNKTVSLHKLSNHILEWPAINPQYAAKEYRYVYGLGAENEQFLYQLIKIDKATEAVRIWQENGCYPGKPIFISAPSSKSEDDGILLSIVLDSIHKVSFLLCLDAITFKEYGRALLPHHIPLGLQGTFIAS